jgi:hypothetical protein
MQHLLNDCSTVFPAIFFQAAETHSASSEVDPLLILLDDVSGRFLDSNQG